LKAKYLTGFARFLQSDLPIRGIERHTQLKVIVLEGVSVTLHGDESISSNGGLISVRFEVTSS
jgi:hypothetical protein